MRKRFFTLAICTVILFRLTAQTYKDPGASVDERVEDLLGRMTLEEKIDYIGGVNDFYIRAVPRLGIPEIKLTDGPVGTHKDGRSTAYPAGVLTASTWNRQLVKELGRQLGRDSRARGVHILLGPGMNILRTPMCGRNFEYFSEDPYLCGETACAYVEGVQSQGVVATLKHFAANNQEWDRNNVSSDIDLRTLHEIYLAPFRRAVQKAGAGAIMDSYNPVNGIHATQNSYLNNDVLRKMWGFDGIVMSDWSATYDGVEAANGGLDLEMPRAKCMNQKSLIPAIADGRVDIETINDKVRRLLRLIFANGFFDNIQLDNSIPLDNPQGAAVALDLAREGIVLLKNENNILPFGSNIKKIAVIGPNAAGYISGGGSSYTFPFHSVSLLEGMKSLKPDSVEILYSAGLPTLPETVRSSKFYTASGSDEIGLKGEYFGNINLNGDPTFTRIDSIIDIPNGYHIAAERKGIPYDHCSMRWSGVIRPEKSTKYRFLVRGFDGFRLKVDGQEVINEWRNQGITLSEAVLPLEAGKEYAIELEYFANVHPVDIAFGWREDCSLFDQAAELASNADVAVISVGFNNSLERESNDRTFELPDNHDALINNVLNVNPNTVVVVNAGSNVDMSKWADKVPAIIYLWYPGQEGGTAAAEILYGQVNPSGKLPVSFESKIEYNPAYQYYYDNDGDKRVTYGERLMLGYRHFDSSSVKPRFAFGHGLSYTDFDYSNLKIRPNANKNSFKITFRVKNTGNIDGKETAQVYVRPLHPSVERPFKELKGFDKRLVAAGQSTEYEIELSEDAFSYFDTETHGFVVDPGKYEILVGSASDKILLRKTVSIRK